MILVKLLVEKDLNFLRIPYVSQENKRNFFSSIMKPSQINMNDMQNPLDEPRFYQNIFIYLYKKILY